MKTCDSCAWWEKRKKDGRCDRADAWVIEDEKQGRTVDVHATADDDSGLEVMLITGPKFGCVLHKEKE